MTVLRPELQALVETLLHTHADVGEVSLDAVGEAIGSRAVSQDEIDAIFSALEARGCHVAAATDGRTEERLLQVVAAARALAAELGKRPSVAQIAERSGLSEPQVRGALSLAKIIQR